MTGMQALQPYNELNVCTANNILDFKVKKLGWKA